MNKNVIIAIILVLAAGGYYQYSYKPAQEAAAVAAPPASGGAAVASANANAATRPSASWMPRAEPLSACRGAVEPVQGTLVTLGTQCSPKLPLRRFAQWLVRSELQ